MRVDRLWLTDFRSYDDRRGGPGPGPDRSCRAATARARRNLLEAIGYLATLRVVPGRARPTPWSAAEPSGPSCGPRRRGPTGPLLIEAEIAAGGPQPGAGQPPAAAPGPRPARGAAGHGVLARRPRAGEGRAGGAAPATSTTPLVARRPPQRRAAHATSTGSSSSATPCSSRPAAGSTPEVERHARRVGRQAGQRRRGTRSGPPGAGRRPVAHAAAGLRRGGRRAEPASCARYEPAWLADAVASPPRSAAGRTDDVRRGREPGRPAPRRAGRRARTACPARTHASQGEQRALALALRLAAHQLVTAAAGTPPVLLLDDVFSELDPFRSAALVAHLPGGPDRAQLRRAPARRAPSPTRCSRSHGRRRCRARRSGSCGCGLCQPLPSALAAGPRDDPAPPDRERSTGCSRRSARRRSTPSRTIRDRWVELVGPQAAEALVPVAVEHGRDRRDGDRSGVWASQASGSNPRWWPGPRSSLGDGCGRRPGRCATRATGPRSLNTNRRRYPSGMVGDRTLRLVGLPHRDARAPDQRFQRRGGPPNTSSPAVLKGRAVSPKTQTYSASSMTILEGLAHVRKRPGMYIGGTGITGLHHLVWEVVDNSVDEAMAGYCDRIDVTLLADGGCRVVDNGRGIPTDVNKEFKMTGVEIALTKLGGGGKFGGDGYKVSGGLHGVGVSVVNALSSQGRGRGRPRRQAPPHRVRRRRHEADQARGRRRRARGAAPAPPSRSGPTRSVFEVTEFVGPHAARALPDDGLPQQGPRDPLQGRARGPRPAAGPSTGTPAASSTSSSTSTPAEGARCSRKVGYFEQTEEDHEVELAFQWNTGLPDRRPALASPTASPPSRAAPTRRASAPRSPRWSTSTPRPRASSRRRTRTSAGEDIREGLTAIISVRLREPQFEGQTKAKLGNPADQDAGAEGHQREARRLARGAPHRGQQDRQEGHRRPAGPGRGPPGPRRHPPQVRARRRRHARQAQGLLEPQPPRVRAVHRRGRLGRRLGHQGPRPPHPGDPPDPREDPQRRAGPHGPMLKNNEIQALISAIGAGFGDDEFDVDEDALRQGDPAVRRRRRRQPHPHAAAHVLLPPHEGPMVEHGHVYIAQPPLYSTRGRARRRSTSRTTHAKTAFLAEHPDHKKEFQRLKGLGEMDWEELKDTTMDASRRTLLQVTVEQAANADAVVSTPDGRRRRRPQELHPDRTPRTSASSTSEERTAPMSDTTPPNDDGDDPRRTDRRRRRPSSAYGAHRADRDRRGDGAVVPRLLHVRHRVAGAARRARRPEAGAPPDPLGHARHRRPPRPAVHEVRPGHRRGDGQVPPPRRRRDLRRPRAHGPGLLAAPPAGGRARQLRLARLRPGRRPLHRVPARPRWPSSCSPTSTRTPSTSATTTRASSRSRPSCPAASRTCWSTAARASRWAWPPTSRRTTSARSSTPPST